MSKKNKENYFQGMEHLRPRSSSSSDHRASQEGIGIEGNSALKKELVMVLSLMAFFFLILVGLMMYDKSSTFLADFAQKLGNSLTY